MSGKYRAENWSEGEKVNARQLSACIGEELKSKARLLADCNGMSLSKYIRELIKHQCGLGETTLVKLFNPATDMPEYAKKPAEYIPRTRHRKKPNKKK